MDLHLKRGKMKLTIVTPSYNQGRFIERTFQGILNQELNFELEYILADAVSTDNTAKIVKKYIPKFKRVGIDFIYISEKDKGQSDGINKGWKIATGDIITYINSDDYYEPKVLDKVTDFFKQNPSIKWAYGGGNLVNKKGKIYKSVQPKKYSRVKLLNYCNIGQPSCFFRRELLDEFGMLDQNLHLAMDYDLWLKFASKYNAGILDFVVSNMRYYADAKSGLRTREQLIESLRLGNAYTKPFSWRRACQYYYFLRGIAIVVTKLDITKRIERKCK